MNIFHKPEIITKLQNYCEKQPLITFCYLFGSISKRKSKYIRDIDIAIYLTNEKNDDKLKKKVILFTELSKNLETENIDLVVLNGAPIYLSYRILKEGELLFDRNLRDRNCFQEKIVRYYLDMKYFKEKRDNIIRAYMRKGNYFV